MVTFTKLTCDRCRHWDTMCGNSGNCRNTRSERYGEVTYPDSDCRYSFEEKDDHDSNLLAIEEAAHPEWFDTEDPDNI